MKKILSIILLSLSIVSVAYAEKFLKVCTHQIHEYNYPLLIDFNSMTLTLGPYSNFKINGVEDIYIFAGEKTSSSNIYFSYHRYNNELTHSILTKDNKDIIRTDAFNCE
jgi:hypothetical protein